MKNLGKYIALLAILIASFTTILSSTITRVASPNLCEAFNLDYSKLTWVFNSYLITYAILLPVFGQIGDKYGRRRCLLGGLIAFGTGSLLSGFSWSFGSLVSFRVLQAIGAASIFPNAVITATNLFPLEHRGKVMGTWGMVNSLGMASGPSVGGFIVQYLGWRYLFFVNVPFVMLSFISIMCQVKSDSTKPSSSFKFDSVGMIILAVVVVSMVTALQGGSETGLLSPSVIIMFIVFLASLLLLARIEARSADPIIDLNLLKSRVFISGTYCGGTHIIAIQGVQFLMPLFLAQVQGFDPLAIGLMMAPQATMRLVISPVAGILEDKYGNRVPVTLGIVVRAVSLLSFAFLTPTSSKLLIATALLVDGTGCAFIWSPTMNAVIKSSLPDKASSTVGVFNMLRFLIGAIGLVLIGLIMDNVFNGTYAPGRPVPGFYHAYMGMAILNVFGLIFARNLATKKVVQPCGAALMQ